MLLQYFLVASKMLTFKNISLLILFKSKKKKDFVSWWKLTRGYTEIVRALVFLQFLQRHIFVAMDHSLFAHQSIHLNNKKQFRPFKSGSCLRMKHPGGKVVHLAANNHNKHSRAKLYSVNDCWHLLGDHFVGQDCKLWGRDLRNACWQSVKSYKAGLQS